jgi:hypothetical protein
MVIKIVVAMMMKMMYMMMIMMMMMCMVVMIVVMCMMVMCMMIVYFRVEGMILFETKEERSENSHLLSMKNEAVSPPVGSMSRILQMVQSAMTI